MEHVFHLLTFTMHVTAVISVGLFTAVSYAGNYKSLCINKGDNLV